MRSQPIRSRRVRECDNCGADRPEFHLRRAALVGFTQRVVGHVWLCGLCWGGKVASDNEAMLLDALPIRRMLVRKGRIREVPS